MVSQTTTNFVSKIKPVNVNHTRKIMSNVFGRFLNYICIHVFPFLNLAVTPLMSLFSFGATAPIWALAYLRETPRSTSVYYISDIR
jgi:hypothetical protein